ncbi:MAG: alpha/beta fold hydrolase [Rhodobacteraceae bacterium]|nr:alpha/beta fold hydrolase [Paracoccaceae bacterium]
MTPDQIVALVLALTSPQPAEPLFPVIAAGGIDPRYAVAAAPCPGPLAPDEVEGHTVVCGTVNLPENHDRPDGRRIDLTFMVLKSRSLSPAPDPVVYLHGGPGHGIMRDPVLITRFLGEIRSRRHIVAFDQRGVDSSAGPDSRCYATVADEGTLEQAVTGTGDRAALGRQAIRACLSEIAANGADISTVNTLQNAYDVRALMQALGFPSYNIFGTSYGTKLGQEVMRSAPEGLRAVVLDSVWPVQVPMYDLMGLPLAENIRSLFDQCAADAACAAAYPDLEARFWALWAKLEAAPIASAQGPISGRSLAMLLIGRNSYSPAGQKITGYLPQIIAELERGETRTYEEIAAGRLGLPASPEMVLAGLSGLDADTQGFAEAALRLAEMGRLNEEAARAALIRLEADRDRAVRGTDLVDAFEAALADAARALPDQPSRIAFGSDYLMLRAGDRTGDALGALLGRHFEGAALAGLLALRDRMTEAQIGQVFDRVGADNSRIDDMLVGQFQLQMFACQEDMVLNGPATIPQASAMLQAEFGWPEAMTAEIEQGMIAGVYEPCEEFAQQPRPGMNDPVTADIPTLVLQGGLDTQTAPSWGALMVSSLPRGQLAFMPESGHGTFIFSDCSRDIAARFLDTPDASVDTSCTADLIPAFLLPDGTWSRPH